MEHTRVPVRLGTAQRLAAAFGPTVIVAVFGALAAWGAVREHRSREAVALSQEIRTTLARLLTRVTEGETGQRGYLLTGSPAYLAPYLRAQSDAARLAARLRALTRDPAQVARADSLQMLVGAKFDELAETVEVHDALGAAAALRIVQTGRGRGGMERIRAVAARMEAREDRLLAGRAAREDARSRALLLLLVVGTAAAAGLSLALNAVIARYSAGLAIANAELGRANEQLREQQTELELQNDLLQEQSAELEAQNVQLEEQSVELEMQNQRLLESGAELERRTEAAEAASVAKSRFLASMSHDLRTPLNAILGYAQLLETGVRGPVTEAQASDLRRIRGSGRHLFALLSSILDYARMEAGRVEVRLAVVPLDPLVHDVESSFLPQLAARDLEYAYQPADGPVHVLADPDKLEQVLLNLVTNAIKFTEPGGRITLACVESGDAVLVQVRDTGRGIPRDRLPGIFEPFVQVDRERTEAAHQGVGLGLAISRELARAMGGDLAVESTVGVGSVFTLRVRRAPAADRRGPPVVAVAAAPDGAAPQPVAG
ncbi:MAG TPA: CHASE3 domain-containing protein [Longimicrobiaceae bacterium]|jgi:signal transduction histidine kinase